MPGAGPLTGNTRAAFADVDAGPTKAWVVTHRYEEAVKEAFALGFLRRPAEELYDVAANPHQTTNLADDPAHAEAKTALAARLMRHLEATGDPRVTGDGSTFDNPPYATQQGYERLPGGGVKRSDR